MIMNCMSLKACIHMQLHHVSRIYMLAKKYQCCDDYELHVSQSVYTLRPKMHQGWVPFHFSTIIAWLHGARNLSCTLGGCLVFPLVSWLGWWFLHLCCLLRLLRKKLSRVTRHDCMQRGYKMERCRTVSQMPEMAITPGTKQTKTPNTPWSLQHVPVPGSVLELMAYRTWFTPRLVFLVGASGLSRGKCPLLGNSHSPIPGACRMNPLPTTSRVGFGMTPGWIAV